MLVLLGAAALFGLTRLLSGSGAGAAIALTPVASAAPTSAFRTPLPEEIRGVHITGPLMSLPGKFEEYLALKRDGLNTVEVDVKDESGNVSFLKGAPAIALKDGAARPYFDAAEGRPRGARRRRLPDRPRRQPSRIRSPRSRIRSSRSTAATARSGRRTAGSAG